MKPYQTKKTKNIRRFTQEEDDQLKELVKLYGESNWIMISCKMEHRNSRQCKDRWEEYLSPTTNRTPWSKEEELRLMTLVSQYGKKWLFLSKFFDRRPDSQIRNKFKTIEHKFQSMKIPQFNNVITSNSNNTTSNLLSSKELDVFDNMMDFDFDDFF